MTERNIVTECGLSFWPVQPKKAIKAYETEKANESSDIDPGQLTDPEIMDVRKKCNSMPGGANDIEFAREVIAAARAKEFSYGR